MTLRDLIRRLLGAEPHGGGGAAGADEPGFEDAGDDAAVDLFDPFPEPVALEIEDVIDLHAFAPRDVKRAVGEYLLEARRAGFHSVRIIHGKGRGVQRELVRKILARTPFVVSFADAPPAAGGFGATVAHLRNDERGAGNAEGVITPFE